MSYRELRNFCEIMRALGYPRLISMENFKKPNFELVADILYWLCQRYNPKVRIPDEIEDVSQRVDFIKQVALLFVGSKTRIKLNTKKLYMSDSSAIQEILKVAEILYKAHNSSPGNEDERTNFQLPAKLNNIKSHKQQSTDIQDLAIHLSDSLNKEPELKQQREKALNFLDQISNNMETNNEQQYIEKCVKEIIQQQTEHIDEMQKYVQTQSQQQKTLEQKIQKLQLEVDRGEKRLQMLMVMKPPYWEEYERLQTELERIYAIYIEKFRNLDYLEKELEEYHKVEQVKMKKQQEKIVKNWENANQEDLDIITGKMQQNEQDIDKLVENNQFTRSGQQSRGAARDRNYMGGANGNQGNLMHEVDEDDIDDEDDGEGMDDDEEGLDDGDEMENSEGF